MSSLVWEDRFSVGVTVIDDDHRILIALINHLDDAGQDNAGREVIESVLTVLMEYVQGHFTREEKLMELAHYPDLVQHQAVHARLRVEAEAHVARFHDDPGYEVRDLIIFLTRWLMDHILDVDSRYTPWVQNLEINETELDQPIDIIGHDASE